MVQSRASQTRLANRRAAEWADYCKGMTQAALSKKYKVTQTVISEDLRIYRESIPAQDKDQLRAQHLDLLAHLTGVAMELVEGRPVPVTAGKDGDIVLDPETGKPVWDHSGRLAAYDRVLKAQDAVRKLVGLDAPTQTEISATVEHREPEILDLIAKAKAEAAAREAEIRGP